MSIVSRLKRMAVGSQAEAFKAEHPDEVAKLEKQYGPLEEHYVKSGKLMFTKRDQRMSPEDMEKWYTMWDSVILKAFGQFMTANNDDGDYELDRDTGLVTVWTEEHGLPIKRFFRTVIYGDVNTYLDVNTFEVLRVDIDPATPVHIEFEYAGDKQ